MMIAGLQKLSLVDFPGKVACTVFTGGCNLRCPFCHNFELVESPDAQMTEEELFRFLDRRTGMLDGVCITGGEPCMHKDLPDLMRGIRARGFAVKLDSNGCYPDRLRRILEEGLADYIAMDIKNSPDEYARTVGLQNFSMDSIRESLSLLLNSNTDFELRTTLAIPFHTEASIRGIVEFLLPFTEAAGRRFPHFFLQAFVDRDTVPFAGLSAPSEEDMRAWAEILKPIAESVELRGV